MAIYLEDKELSVIDNKEVINDIRDGKTRLFYVVSFVTARTIGITWSLNETYVINYYRLLDNRYPNQHYPVCGIYMYDRIHNSYPDIYKIIRSGNEIRQYTSKYDKSYSICLPMIEYDRFLMRCVKASYLRNQVLEVLTILCDAYLEIFRNNYFKDTLRKIHDTNIIPVTQDKYKTNFDFVKWFVITDMKYLEDIGDKLYNQHMYIKESKEE